MKNRNNKLSYCIITTKDSAQIFGALFFRNKYVAVLLNNTVTTADLGPIRKSYLNYIENESDITIIPISIILKIELLNAEARYE
jgi:hypothetical protein